MKKYLIVLLALCMFLVALCTACTRQDVPSEVKKFYIEYMEMSLKDPYTAVNKYCHFESAENKMAAEKSSPILSYEILGWERISDSLWAVKITGVAEMTPNGVTCKNYIGIIDGKYYVMPNIIHVPAGLKEGIEIEPYEPHGEDLVDPDDVIGPIEIKPYDPYGENTTDPDDVIPSIA